MLVFISIRSSVSLDPQNLKNRGDFMDVKKLSKYGLVMALYIVLSLLMPQMGYGPIQFRLAEILTLLAFVDSSYVLPITLACAIVNFWSPFGLVDVVFGSLHSFIALKAMTKTDNIYLASIFPAIFSVIIALEILIFSPEAISFFLVAGQIMLSQFIIVSLIGVPIFKVIMKNEYLMNLITINGNKDNS